MLNVSILASLLVASSVLAAPLDLRMRRSDSKPKSNVVWLGGLRTAGVSDLGAKKCGPIESKDFYLSQFESYVQASPGEKLTADEISNQLSQVFVLKTIGAVLDREACMMDLAIQADPSQVYYAVQQILTKGNKEVSKMLSADLDYVEIPVQYDVEQYQNEVFEAFASLQARRLKISAQSYRHFKIELDHSMRQWVKTGTKPAFLNYLSADEVPDEVFAFFRGDLKPNQDWKRYAQLKAKLSGGSYGFQVDVEGLGQIRIAFRKLPDSFDDFRAQVKTQIEKNLRYYARKKVANTLLFNHWRNLSLSNPLDPGMMIFSEEENKSAYERVKAHTKVYTVERATLSVVGSTPAEACVAKTQMHAEEALKNLQTDPVQTLLSVRAEMASSKECSGVQLRFTHWTDKVAPVYAQNPRSANESVGLGFLAYLDQDIEMQNAAVPFAVWQPEGQTQTLNFIFLNTAKNDEYLPQSDDMVTKAVREVLVARKLSQKMAYSLGAILKNPAGRGRLITSEVEDANDADARFEQMSPDPFAKRRYRVVANEDAFSVGGVEGVKLNPGVALPSMWLQEIFSDPSNQIFEQALQF